MNKDVMSEVCVTICKKESTRVRVIEILNDKGYFVFEDNGVRLYSKDDLFMLKIKDIDVIKTLISLNYFGEE